VVKLYVFIFMLFLICGSWVAAFMFGDLRCKSQTAEQQTQIIQTVNTEAENAQNIINSAGLDDVRRMLCENARGGCKERSNNTPAGM
jgi:hypothetical protein